MPDSFYIILCKNSFYAIKNFKLPSVADTSKSHRGLAVKYIPLIMERLCSVVLTSSDNFNIIASIGKLLKYQPTFFKHIKMFMFLRYALRPIRHKRSKCLANDFFNSSHLGKVTKFVFRGSEDKKNAHDCVTTYCDTKFTSQLNVF